MSVVVVDLANGKLTSIPISCTSRELYKSASNSILPGNAAGYLNGLSGLGIGDVMTACIYLVLLSRSIIIGTYPYWNFMIRAIVTPAAFYTTTYLDGFIQLVNNRWAE